jgi:glutamate transport system permease protein
MSQVILPQAFRGAIAPLGSTLIALIKNTTVAAIIGNQEAAGLMAETVENQGSSISIFLVFALGFVVLTLPLGLVFTSMSRRLVVKR